MKITSVGIDLAKNVFQLHAVDERGKTVLRRQLRRDQMAAFFANLPPCLIGMEACGSAHYWARTLQSFGHTARLMSPQFVKPYVKSNKNSERSDCERARQHALVRQERRATDVCPARVRQGSSEPHGAGNRSALLGEFGLHAGRHLSLASACRTYWKTRTSAGALRQLITRLTEHPKTGPAGR